MEKKSICINKNGLWLLFALLICTLSLKGQSVFPIDNGINGYAINTLSINNGHIAPLLDSICNYWDTSSLSGTYSYATVTPYVKTDKQVVWRVYIRQLYDEEVFFLMFDVPSFFKSLFLYGALQRNNRLFFIGSEKRDYNTPEENSRIVVEKYFRKNIDTLAFRTDSIRKNIKKSSSGYVHQIDTIGDIYEWEKAIYDRYDAVILEYIESDEKFICLKKEIFKDPW